MKFLMRSGVFSAVFLVLGSGVFATTPLKSDVLLKRQISELGPTRIQIEGSRIVDVFSYPDVAARVVLHKTGFVFVVPEEGQKHVYLTVVGENGETQDLRLRFSFMQPQPIILQASSVLEKEKKSEVQ